MTGVGICPERQRLLNSYGEATKAFYLRGRELTDVALSYESDIFQRAWDRCENARQRCADLRHELVAHMQDHSCFLNLFTQAGQQTRGAGG